MTSAFRTGTPGKSDLPLCRMRRKRATSFCSDDKVREFVAAAYRAR